MVLGRRQGVDSDLVAQNGQVANLVHHRLVAFVVAPDGTQLLALLHRRGDRREYQDVEFHASPLGCLKLLN